MTCSVTEGLADAILEASRAPLPLGVLAAAERTLLNVLGATIAGSQSAAVDAIIAAGGRPADTDLHLVPGRAEQVDALTAATAIGTAAHLHDVDNSHARTWIQPGASTLGAVWTAGRRTGASGEQVLRAFALGIEAQLRVGNAISPWHLEDGWHTTGTCGPIGAAVAAGLLLDLDTLGLRQAIGLAASQSLGIRAGSGTLMRPFHAGKAAANGLLAAVLVDEGFTASHSVLEAPRGFFAVMSPNGSDASLVLDGLGTRWELEDNLPKPYPCDAASHAAIHAAISLSSRVPEHSAIRTIVARVHPLVLELTGESQPMDGQQARSSTAHGIAVGLLDGEAGLTQYEDVRVSSEDVQAVRRLVALEGDASCSRDSAMLTVELVTGRRLTARVEHGRAGRMPLLPEEPRDRSMRMIEPVLPDGATHVLGALQTLGEAPNLEALADACTPATVNT